MQLLLTGGTGFIGGAALACLARRYPDLPVLALVRADTPGAASNRLLANLRKYGVRRLPSNWEAVRGDLHQLEGVELQGVTHVLHLAACTSFRSVRRVRHTNLDGTLLLARALRRARRLERFLFVGTAYISGRGAPAVVYEDDYPAAVEQLSEYSRTKAECELALASLSLPLVVARPSAVIGHTTLGCGPSPSLFWYYRAVERLRRTAVPASARRDVVPVDYVAECLAHLLMASHLSEVRYHISAGQGSAVTLEEVVTAFEGCPGYSCGEGPLLTVSVEQLLEERERAERLLAPGDVERILTALTYLWRFTGSGAEVFDNSRLLASGASAPPRFTDYLPVCARLPANRTIFQQLAADE